MRYKLLGRSGLRVSELALGTMTFGEDWGWGASKEVSRKIFDRFAEAGGNFIDTSNNYTEGTSERYVGEFIASQRDYFVVATKYTLNQRQDDPNAGGNHRKNMMQAVEASLKRLNTDYIDLYWLHVWDNTTPIDEIMRAFEDLVRAGKILYIGFSDTPAWVVSRATTLAELRGWSPVVAVQVSYSLEKRSVEREVLPMAKALDIAVLPWGVLGSGVLTGKYNSENDEPKRRSQATDAQKALADALRQVADEIGRPAAQVAINWVRQQQHLAQIIPILGARTEAQIQSNLACLEFELSDEHMQQLSDASPIEYGFPLDFINALNVRGLIHGDMFDKIDNHHV